MIRAVLIRQCHPDGAVFLGSIGVAFVGRNQGGKQNNDSDLNKAGGHPGRWACVHLLRGLMNSSAAMACQGRMRDLIAAMPFRGMA